MPSTFKQLESASDLSDVARAFGYRPNKLSYILYKMGASQKYKTFQILKRSGGQRTICAPCDELKLLQLRLAQALQEERNTASLGRSHGFETGRWIATGADIHRNKRHVFNIDLHDFFGTINFGRVRGFFIKSPQMNLEPAVATVLAQIATYQNCLPQGSPSSPVISNYIASSLDYRLSALAKKYRCDYSRYADDITFSTNSVSFPCAIGSSAFGGQAKVGTALFKAITKTGFVVNSSKCFLFSKPYRQTVTGLVVNKYPNVDNRYYKNTRSMVNSLYQDAEYTVDKSEDPITTLSKLRGRLNHIHHLNVFNREKRKLYSKAKEETYKKFLFYSEILSPERNVIICEGKTDKIYLQSALKSGVLPGFSDARILNYSKTIAEVMNLTGGSSPLVKVLIEADRLDAKIWHGNARKACVVVLDNDTGLNPFKKLFKKYGVDKKRALTPDGSGFYELFSNVYCVIIPKINSKETEIEDYFSETVLGAVVRGKKFYRGADSGFDKSIHFGKEKFAKDVVLPNIGSINFRGFHPVLDMINKAIVFNDSK